MTSVLLYHGLRAYPAFLFSTHLDQSITSPRIHTQPHPITRRHHFLDCSTMQPCLKSLISIRCSSSFTTSKERTSSKCGCSISDRDMTIAYAARLSSLVDGVCVMIGTLLQESSRNNHGASTRSTLHGFSDMRNQRRLQMTMSRELIFISTTKVPGARGRKPTFALSTSSWRTLSSSKW